MYQKMLLLVVIVIDISEKIDDFGSHPQNHHFFRKYEHRGYKKSSDHKNSPEMNDSERDLIIVEFLSKLIEKQKVRAIWI